MIEDQLKPIIEIILVAVAILFILGFVQEGIIVGLAYIIAAFIALVISTISTIIVHMFLAQVRNKS